jgi:hypothetical protein
MCPSCGSPAVPGDRFCRNCGAALESAGSGGEHAGRTLVIVCAVVILGLHVASFLFTMTATSLTGRLTAGDCLSNLVSGGLEVAILFLVFRGHAWARWLMGLLSLATTVLALVFLPPMLDVPVAAALMILVAVGTATVAAILLLVPSVRSFQREQRARLRAETKATP